MIKNNLAQKTQRKTKLSIIIVYFGGYRHLTDLIDSIKQNKIKTLYEIIIVNNKQDESIKAQLFKKYRNIVYIESGSNLGYGKGNNLGAKHASGEYLFIVNPDTRIVRGKVDNLVNFLETHPKAAIIAPNLVDKDGRLFKRQGTRILNPIRAIFSLSIISRLVPNNKFIRDYYMFDIPKFSFRCVDVVLGSAFIIKKKIFDKLHGFDENFFLYFEEADLCKRIRKLSFDIFMSYFLVMEHDWKSASNSAKLKKAFQKSRFYYFKKQFGLQKAVIVEFFLRITKKNLVLFLVLVSLSLLVFLVQN